MAMGIATHMFFNNNNMVFAILCVSVSVSNIHNMIGSNYLSHEAKNVFTSDVRCDNLLQSCVNSFMFCSNYTPGLGIGKEIKPPLCASPMTPY